MKRTFLVTVCALMGTTAFAHLGPIEDDCLMRGKPLYDFDFPSEVLKRNDIQLVVSEPTKTGAATPAFCEELDTKPFSQLTQTGVLALEKDPVPTSKLPWGCGEDLEAAHYKYTDSKAKPEGASPFIARGAVADASKILKWSPAKGDSVTELGCAGPSADYKLNKKQAARLDGIEGLIVVSEWQRKAAPSPDAEYNCAKDEYVFEVYQINADKCKLLVQSKVDCDRNPGPDHFVYESLLGVIRAEDSSSKETWLIFDAPGYEGQGIGAVPLKNGVLDPNQAGHIQHQGC